MGSEKICLTFCDVDFDSLQTDEDFRREAQRILPEVIVQLGEAIGEKAWDQVRKALGRSTSASASERGKFIREAGESYQRDLSAKERKELENNLVRQLREQKPFPT